VAVIEATVNCAQAGSRRKAVAAPYARMRGPPPGRCPAESGEQRCRTCKLLTGGAKKDSKAQRPHTMGIRRRTDDMRASTPAHGTDPAARAKAISVVERWKKQLAAGQDLERTGEPSTNEPSSRRSASGEPHHKDRGGDQGLSDVGVLINLAVLALVCVGGYFLLMKLVEISRQEDCFLGGGRNCVRLQVPSNR
jgi:hypothetical protein